jgi:hypothetical protein
MYFSSFRELILKKIIQVQSKRGLCWWWICTSGVEIRDRTHSSGNHPMIVYFFRREPSPPKVLLKEGKSFCDPRLFTNVYVIWITKKHCDG